VHHLRRHATDRNRNDTLHSAVNAVGDVVTRATEALRAVVELLRILGLSETAAHQAATALDAAAGAAQAVCNRAKEC
jgi:hypothetical protein